MRIIDDSVQMFCICRCVWMIVWMTVVTLRGTRNINPLNAELNPICHFLALLGVHHILHVSGIRVKRDF
jgi:hypothetical protein